jgi:hypothetical protein
LCQARDLSPYRAARRRVFVSNSTPPVKSEPDSKSSAAELPPVNGSDPPPLDDACVDGDDGTVLPSVAIDVVELPSVETVTGIEVVDPSTPVLVVVDSMDVVVVGASVVVVVGASVVVVVGASVVVVVGASVVVVVGASVVLVVCSWTVVDVVVVGASVVVVVGASVVVVVGATVVEVVVEVEVVVDVVVEVVEVDVVVVDVWHGYCSVTDVDFVSVSRPLVLVFQVPVTVSVMVPVRLPGTSVVAWVSPLGGTVALYPTTG